MIWCVVIYIRDNFLLFFDLYTFKKCIHDLTNIDKTMILYLPTFTLKNVDFYIHLNWTDAYSALSMNLQTLLGIQECGQLLVFVRNLWL